MVDLWSSSQGSSGSSCCSLAVCLSCCYPCCFFSLYGFSKCTDSRRDIWQTQVDTPSSAVFRGFPFYWQVTWSRLLVYLFAPRSPKRLLRLSWTQLLLATCPWCTWAVFCFVWTLILFHTTLRCVGCRFTLHPKLLTSHHLNTSQHITSRHITSHHVASRHIASHHFIFRRNTSYHVTSHHISSAHHITSHHVTSHHITSHRIRSHNNTSHITSHITPQHNTSHLNTSHHISPITYHTSHITHNTSHITHNT